MNVLNNFYIKVWLKAFALCCLVYSFLLTNFMWGNHDWKFLRKGVKYYNGFYELRFSHHSIAHLVLDGHLLPIITLLLSLMLVSLFAVIIAQYLNIPKKQALYLCFVLFICLNPHIFVIHYYLHYGFQVCFWAMVGVFGLNYSAQSKSLIRACLSGLLYLLVVGSYPPIFSLIIILFITKRLLNYIENKENFKTIFIESVYFLLQLFIMIIGYKLIEYILIKNGYVGLGMYNIKTKTAFDMLYSLPTEIYNSFNQFFIPFIYNGFEYSLLLLCLIYLAIILVFKQKFNLISFAMVLAIFMCSRIIVIIAQSEVAEQMRILYWGQIGVYISALSIISRCEKQIIHNFLYILILLCLSIFIKSDFEVQKTLNLSFKNEINYKDRVINNILNHKNLNTDKIYFTFSFGQPHFQHRFYDKVNYKNDFKYRKLKSQNELMGNDLAFDRDFLRYAFLDEIVKTVDIEYLNVFSYANEIELNRINNWIDSNPKVYPNKESIYINDRYIVINLETVRFNMFKYNVMKEF